MLQWQGERGQGGGTAIFAVELSSEFANQGRDSDHRKRPATQGAAQAIGLALCFTLRTADLSLASQLIHHSPRLARAIHINHIIAQ